MIELTVAGCVLLVVALLVVPSALLLALVCAGFGLLLGLGLAAGAVLLLAAPVLLPLLLVWALWRLARPRPHNAA